MGSWSDLNAWLMPPKAQQEWLALSTLLEQLPDDQVPCRVDPTAWWPDRKLLNSPTTTAAVMACGGCLAREACLAYALAADEGEGIWGGVLPAERIRPGTRPAAA